MSPLPSLLAERLVSAKQSLRRLRDAPRAKRALSLSVATRTPPAARVITGFPLWSHLSLIPSCLRIQETCAEYMLYAPLDAERGVFLRSPTANIFSAHAFDVPVKLDISSPTVHQTGVLNGVRLKGYSGSGITVTRVMEQQSWGVSTCQVNFTRGDTTPEQLQHQKLLACCVSSTRESLYMVSTVPSTVWGPGTVAGRAILALGEATLKGLDRIVDLEARAIQRRLATIRRNLPILTADMYNDLIELSLQGGQVPADCGGSRSNIWLQIESGHSGAFALSLSQLWLGDLQWVLCQIIYSRPQLTLAQSQRELELINGRFFRELTYAAGPRFLDNLGASLRRSVKVIQIAYADLRRSRYTQFRSVTYTYAELRAPLLISVKVDVADYADLPTPTCTFIDSAWNNWTQLESAGGPPAEDRLLNLKAVLLNPSSEDWPWNPDFWDAAHDLFDFIRHWIDTRRFRNCVGLQQTN
ncbi:hypothetical protein B0H16DRAFT_1691470 [Mycena metata]|uniref:Uncharacterized protein n=1 Tax=Mycena metata TaxID=1033252 RepID=A0AAD7N9X9_9AGAR|nr:hypothetical protein B0H16DRAFT_1691470 [Mycena metata]